MKRSAKIRRLIALCTSVLIATVALVGVSASASADPIVLAASTLPSITGTPAVGSTLTADPGVWNDTGVTFAYQWLGNGSNISKATKVTYAPVAADASKVISVKVTATKSGDTTGTATSAATAAVVGLNGDYTAFLTMYGWWDNTPPGGGISYPGLHSTAGGTGTYADPITFATSNKELAPGTKVYVPRFGKYFIMEDSCQECGVDFAGQGVGNTQPGPNGGPGLIHFDLWVGGQGGNAFDAIDCEDALTNYNSDGTPTLEPIIINPGSDLTVDPTPMFDSTTGDCYGGAVASSTVGQYENVSTNTCIVDPGNSADAGTALAVAECDSSASQRFTFNGAFLIINNECAQMDTTGTPRAIRLEPCDGGPNQQWSVNPDLTITDIQTGNYSMASSSGVLIADRFNGNPTDIDKWNFTHTTLAQSISFDPLPDATFGDADFAVSATATSGLDVTFAATGPCTVTGTEVSLTGGGDCTITASQAGNDDYDAATDVSQTFTVNTAGQSVTFDALPGATYGDADFSVSATASSTLDVAYAASGDCTVTGALVHLTAAGNCSITASQAGDNNYSPATDVVQSFAIAKSDQTITFGTLQDATLGEGNFAVSATASSALAVSFAADGTCSISGSTVHLTGLGDCTITASQAGGDNYNAAADVQQTFTVVAPIPAAALVIVPGSGHVASGAPVSFTVTAVDAHGNVLGDVSDVAVFSGLSASDSASWNTVSFGKAGSRSVKATVGQLSVTAKLTVDPGALSRLAFVSPVTKATSGQKKSFTVRGFDGYGNALGTDHAASYAIAGAGFGDSVSGDTVTFGVAGARTVVATDGSVHTGTTVAVKHGALASLAIANSTPTRVVAGDSITFAVTGADADHNDVGSVISGTTVKSTVASDSIKKNRVTLKAVGNHTLTFKDGKITTTWTVTVVAAAYSTIVWASGSTTAYSGVATSFAIERADASGNPLSSATAVLTATGPGSTVDNGAQTVTFTSLGKRTVTATFDGHTITKKVTVKLDSAAVALTIPTVHAGAATTVTVTVTAGASAVTPTGVVHLHYGSKSVTGQVTLVTGSTVQIVLPALKKGKHTVYAKFVGSSPYGTTTTAKHKVSAV